MYVIFFMIYIIYDIQNAVCFNVEGICQNRIAGLLIYALNILRSYILQNELIHMFMFI